MQTRRRSRHRSRSGGVARLIALLIGVVVPGDVRRQWHLAVALQQPLNRCRVGVTPGELDDATTTGSIGGHNLQGDGLLLQGFKPHLIARLQLLARSCQTKPAPLTPRFQHQQFRETTT